MSHIIDSGDSWSVPVAGALFLMVVLALLPLRKDGYPLLGTNFQPPTIEVPPDHAMETGRVMTLGERIGLWVPLPAPASEDSNDESDKSILVIDPPRASFSSRFQFTMHRSVRQRFA